MKAPGNGAPVIIELYINSRYRGTVGTEEHKVEMDNGNKGCRGTLSKGTVVTQEQTKNNIIIIFL